MTRDDWFALAERFAPQVRLALTASDKTPSDEMATYVGEMATYVGDPRRPASVGWYLERCILIDGLTVLKKPTPEKLGQCKSEDAYLKAKLPQCKEETPCGESDPSKVEMYVHIRAASGPGGGLALELIDIQYWFFYPDDPSHVADWEHLTVRVANWRTLAESSIVMVFFAAHHPADGRWLVQASQTQQKGAYRVVDGTQHVVAYSALGKHATYECAGEINGDVTSDGLRWGSLTREKLQFASIDEACYAPGDARIEPAPWLAFPGKWGQSKHSPCGPSHQGPYSVDEAQQVAHFGEVWGENFGTRCVALGRLGSEDLLAVGRSGPNHARFMLFGRAGERLVERGSGGASWPDDAECAAIAIGSLGNQAVLAVASYHESEPSRLEVYRTKRFDTYVGGTRIGCAQWGKAHACAALAFGRLGEQSVPVLGVGLDVRDHARGSRFEIYRWQDNALARWHDGGANWGKYRGCTAIAFGDWGGQPVVAVGRSAGTGVRYELYRLGGDGLELVASGGGDLCESAGVTDLAFGEVGGEPVLGVALKADAGPRFRVLTPNGDASAFTSCLEGGSGWSKGRCATGIAFGELDGEQVMAVSRTGDDHMRIALYRELAGQLVEFSVYGDGWGDRDATAVAIGSLGGQHVIAYGRSAGDNNRGGLLRPV